MHIFKHKKNSAIGATLVASLFAGVAGAADFAAADWYTISDSTESSYSFQAYNSEGVLTTYYLTMASNISDTSTSDDSAAYYNWVDGKLTEVDASAAYDFYATYDDAQARVQYSTVDVTATRDCVAIKTSGSGLNQGGASYVTKTGISITGSYLDNAVYKIDSTYTADNSFGGAISITSAGGVSTLTGDFIGNYTDSAAASTYAYGGAVNNVGSVGTLTGSFISNYSNGYTGAYGGAISNTGTVDSITGDFINNYVLSEVGTYARGGAIYNTKTISSVEGNFIGNYASNSTSSQGGAVYNASAITFTASEGKSYSYLGNYATQGGFMYTTGTVEFAVASEASIVIGYTASDIANDSTLAGYDSIEGSGSITKTGAGLLTINSSMSSYTGSLSVEAGTVEINNSLASTAISITSGATLYVQDIADSITLSVYLNAATSDTMFSIGDSTTLSTLSIYLSEDFVTSESVVIYSDSDISLGTLAVYSVDSEGETTLLEDGYTFENGTFTLMVAVPEPSTYAMIIGFFALGFAYYRRRR